VVSLEAWFTLAVVVLAVSAMLREWLAASLAVVGAMVLLLVVGVITPAEALAGFSNAAPVTVAALFVVARAVEKTGALQPLLASTLSTPQSPRITLLRLLIPTAGASTIFNNTPIVAMLAPQVATWAQQRGQPASAYLMPISFATILGGMVTLIGTSTNLVVSGLLEEMGDAPLGMLEMTRVALPIAIVGVALLIVLAPRLLPERRGLYASFEHKLREFSVEMEVRRGGAVEGRTVEEAGLRNLQGVYLVRIERGGRILAPAAPNEVLQGGDLLGFVGRADLVVDLQQMRGLRTSEHHHASQFRDGAHGFFEAVNSPTSPLVGKTLSSVDFRERYQAAVVAIHRAGEHVHAKLGKVQLRAGDTLLLLARHGFREQWKDRRDFLLVASLDGTMPVGSRKGLFVLAVAGAVVVLAALGILPILKGALLAALLMVLTGILTPNEAARAVDMNVILLISAAFGVGSAIEVSGLASVLAGGIVGAALPLGPVAVLAAVILCTVALTELITNNAAAVLMFPVAVAAAHASGADPRGFAWAVALAASASFLTPIGYQTNTMVYGLGGYRFGDYVRLGLPLTLTTIVGIVGLIALSGALVL
jgi:di/tricarboxylate transporter